MKKSLVISFLLLSFTVFSQSITVDTSTYTPTQLINDVLINSPCVNSSNVTSRTGTNFGSVNGIGYFTNTNPNFPFASGVIMTTGDATKAPSPNNTILSDGNMAWAGDAELEANILSQSGLVMNSINASVLEFDFTPKTANFDFSFLFASEEYGTSQCNYSDAFAFLLTDLTTGVTTNIAVIPSTNIPVSVETIRDNAYNANCPSANPAYFGSFNVSGFGPAINFNGQTVQMSATATVLTTHQYHIKLVIADGGNNIEYDSAIFIEAGSFNIGQDVLGPDYTIANGNASCLESPTLPILSAAGLDPATTFVWRKGNAVIAGQTSSTLDLNTATLPSPLTPGQNIFSVVYTEPGCVGITDSIIVEIYPLIRAIANVPNIYESCSAVITQSFDLTKNTTIILNNNTPANIADDLPADTQISYYLSSALAATGNTADQLSSPYSTTNQSTTIYVRIQNPTTQCYTIRSFNVETVPAPVIAAIPAPLSSCSGSTNTPATALFDLDAAKAAVLGSQDPTYNIVSFHSTQQGADNKTAIINPNANNQISTVSTTIYIRIQNVSNPNCYTTTSLVLTASPLPKVDFFPDVFVCTSYLLETPVEAGVEYWTGTDGTGTQLFPGGIVNTNMTIFVYASNAGCSNESSFSVTISDLPLITPPTATYCTEYRLPVLPYGSYFTAPNPNGTQVAAGTLITETTTLYVRFTDDTETPVCVQERAFTITIIPFTVLPSYSNKFSCNAYTLLADTYGGTYYAGTNKTGGIIAPNTVITSTTTIYVYKETGTSPLNCKSQRSFTVFITLSSISPVSMESCSTYILPALPIGQYWSGPSGTGTQYNAGDPITDTTTLFFYVPGESCTYNYSFTITVILQALPPMPDIEVCELYLLPAVAHSGNYYTGSLGTGTQLAVGSQISTTQTVYFYDKAPTGTCYVQETILIKINPAPPIDTKPAQVAICNATYTLGDLVNGEYYEFSGGLSPTNPILAPGTVIAASKTIYIRSEAIAPSTCFKEYSVEVIIDNIQVNDIADVYSCDTYQLPAITGIGNYYTLSGGPKTVGNVQKNPGDPITTTTTLYVYADNNNRLLCSDEDVFTVNILNTPVIDPITNPDPQCDFYLLPAYNTFTSTPANAVNQYYTLPGGSEVSGNTQLFPGDSITATTTIYVSAAVGTAATKICFSEQPLVVTIIPTPILDPVGSVNACNTYTLPALTEGNYYSDSAHTLPITNTTLTATQTVYVYAENGTAPFVCTASADFIVDINTEPTISPVPDTLLTVCDTDGVNDFKADFDLDSLTSTILGTQDPTEFGVLYYESLNDLTADTPIATDGGTAFDANISVIYFKVYNLTGAQCFVSDSVTLIAIPFPESDPLKGIICIDSETGEIDEAIINSNYSSSIYTFSWTDADGVEVSTAPSFQTSTPGTYSLVITPIGTVASCESDPIPVTVIDSAKPADVSFETTGWFSDNQTITVNAVPYIGDGSNFLYSLDGNTPQTSNIFTNVTGGPHEITVSDSNGCGAMPLPISIRLIESPKFFTPNADGFNDTWKIVGLEDQTEATLFIFDRYGKLIKQLFLNGDGWDGTFNGQPMPATDYWFNLKYVEQGVSKEYKSHFSLVR